MADADERRLGRVFTEVPELYDRVRPGYPDELFADLVTITGLDERSSVLEVGCGSGQATRSLAALGCSVRWYPTVQWFTGDGFADLLRSTSLYRRLDHDVREPLADAVAERIRTRMDDRAARRYLSVLRVGQRAGLPVP